LYQLSSAPVPYEEDGLPAAWHLAEVAAVEISLGRYDESHGLAGLAEMEYELTLLDVSGTWALAPGSRLGPAIAAGVGWAFAEAGADVIGLPRQDYADDTPTLHAGILLRIPVSREMYVRPEVRARYLVDPEDVDLELTVALGLKFGG
jgi:hypothetical protein